MELNVPQEVLWFIMAQRLQKINEISQTHIPYSWYY